MADGTAIEWTDATWNPVTGCSVVSPGCTNCYAMRLAGTRLKHHPTRAGLTIDTKAGPVWNGQVRLNREALHQPLGWKRPRMIFVCAHGDLFHEAAPDEWIDQVFAVMALCPQHTFQVLTKRSARMRDYLNWSQRPYRIASAALSVGRNLPDGHPGWSRSRWKHSPIRGCTAPAIWPLPNVWLGVSAEDQRRADERIPELLDTPAAIRFVSAEPLLGPIDLTNIVLRRRDIEHFRFDVLNGHYRGAGGWPEHPQFIGRPPRLGPLHWVIVGGESGPGARPMHPDWARSIRDQCAAADVPFFFKQWGAWAHMPMRAHFKELYREEWRRVSSARVGVRHALMFNVGKKTAGRLLDGVEHSAFPAPRELPFG